MSTVMSENKSKSKLALLQTELERFKLVQNLPKLYLANYFSDLRNQIDLNAENLLTKLKDEVDAQKKSK